MKDVLSRGVGLGACPPGTFLNFWYSEGASGHLKRQILATN